MNLKLDGERTAAMSYAPREGSPKLQCCFCNSLYVRLIRNPPPLMLMGAFAERTVRSARRAYDGTLDRLSQIL